MFNKNEHTKVPLLDRSAPFRDDIVVSKDRVIKLLKGLNPSKALGPDELHPRVLKELATELGPVFAHLFQQSIATGKIPKEWSLANICPLFKRNDRSLACNYRHVSLFVCLCRGLTSQSTIFQSCRDGATASWAINQYFRGVKCLAQGHNTAAVGFEPQTSRSGVRHSTTEPPRSPTMFPWLVYFASYSNT